MLTFLIDYSVVNNMYIDISVSNLNFVGHLLDQNNNEIKNLAFTSDTGFNIIILMPGYLNFKSKQNISSTAQFMANYTFAPRNILKDQLLPTLFRNCLADPPQPIKITYQVKIYSSPLEAFKVTPTKDGTATFNCPLQSISTLRTLSQFKPPNSGASGSSVAPVLGSLFR